MDFASGECGIRKKREALDSACFLFPNNEVRNANTEECLLTNADAVLTLDSKRLDVRNDVNAAY